jgi:hypothetical protein
MIRIEISRAKWGRGVSDGSALKRLDNGKMCCLGFVCVTAGIPEEKLVAMGYPHALFLAETFKAVPYETGQGQTPVEGPLYGKPIPEALHPFISGVKSLTVPLYRSELTTRLAQINDNTLMSDSTRERQFVFVD